MSGLQNQGRHWATGTLRIIFWRTERCEQERKSHQQSPFVGKYKQISLLVHKLRGMTYESYMFALIADTYSYSGVTRIDKKQRGAAIDAR